MPNQLNIRDLKFGWDDAESEEKAGFLKKLFLNTSVYYRIQKPMRELVIGRQGAGKSALCLMLKNALESAGVITVLITPSLLLQQKIQQLQVSSKNRNETYVLGWKYTLLVEVAKRIIEVGKESRAQRELKNLKKIHKFLAENEETEKTLFERIFKKTGAISKVTIRAGVEVEVGTQHYEEAQKDATNELGKFQSELEAVLAELGDMRIVLLIDKVDEVWDQTEESEIIIIGLLKAVHDLNISLQHTHALAFLRSDIYDFLEFSEANKFHSLEERIDWGESDLKRLIATRIKVFTNSDESDPDNLWNIVFDNQVNNEPSFEYIVKRTFKRPRDLIQFCNKALEKAQDRDHNSITENDVLDAEKQYSNWKLQDLANEYKFQYPYLSELLPCFQELEAETTRREFGEWFQKQKANNRTLMKYSDLEDTSPDRLLQILFRIGFLGASTIKGFVFVYDDPFLHLRQSESVVVHPAFRSALDRAASDLSDDRAKHIWPYQISRTQVNLYKYHLGLLIKEKVSLEKQCAKYDDVDTPVHLLEQLADVEDQVKAIQAEIDYILQEPVPVIYQIFDEIYRLEELCHREPKNWQHQMNLGRHLFYLGDAKTAREHFITARLLGPGTRGIKRGWIISASLVLGDVATAKRILDEVRARDEFHYLDKRYYLLIYDSWCSALIGAENPWEYLINKCLSGSPGPFDILSYPHVYFELAVGLAATNRIGQAWQAINFGDIDFLNNELYMCGLASMPIFYELHEDKDYGSKLEDWFEARARYYLLPPLRKLRETIEEWRLTRASE